MFFVPFPLSRLLSLSILTFLLASPALPAQKPDELPSGNSDIITEPVRGSGFVATPIAIPTFLASDGLTGGLIPGHFRDIIYRDLEWYSEFARVDKQQFIDETHRRDLRAGKINMADWQRLKANFVLKGEFTVKNGTITADVRLYDIIYGVEAFGYHYTDYTIQNARALAHRISDDIVKTVFIDAKPITRTHIIYVSRRTNPVSKEIIKEIWIMDADGRNQKQITRDASLAVAPCWGKNGTEIYYTSYRDTNTDLCGFQLGSGRQWYVSQRPGMNYAAEWCERAERIALTLSRDGNNEIYTMDRSARENTLKRLTFSAGIDTSPSWNPAGNQIAFNSDRTGYAQIYIMNADGTHPRVLTTRGRYNTSPAWSPHGKTIAFVGRNSAQVHDIYTIDLQGQNLKALTANLGNNEDPYWSPDGRHIVFTSERTGTAQIYIMRDDGTNQQQLTFQGVNQSPAWSPFVP